MKVYGKPEHTEVPCPSCKAEIGVYCGLVHGYPAVHENRIHKERERHGSVEEVAYVGDTAPVTVKCAYCTFDRFYKGKSIQNGWDILAEHRKAKHPS